MTINDPPLEGLNKGDPVKIIGGVHKGKTGQLNKLTPKRVGVSVPGRDKPVALLRSNVVSSLAALASEIQIPDAASTSEDEWDPSSSEEQIDTFVDPDRHSNDSSNASSARGSNAMTPLGRVLFSSEQQRPAVLQGSANHTSNSRVAIQQNLTSQAHVVPPDEEDTFHDACEETAASIASFVVLERVAYRGDDVFNDASDVANTSTNPSIRNQTPVHEITDDEESSVSDAEGTTSISEVSFYDALEGGDESLSYETIFHDAEAIAPLSSPAIHRRAVDSISTPSLTARSQPQTPTLCSNASTRHLQPTHSDANDFEALVDAVGGGAAMESDYFNGRLIDHYFVTTKNSPPNSFASSLFRHRICNIKSNLSDSSETRESFQENGMTYELLSTSMEKKGCINFPTYELQETYVRTSGVRCPHINLQRILENVASFGTLPPEKIPKRLDLLKSKTRTMIDLHSSEDLELIDEVANEGCGFLPRSYIERILGRYQVGKRTFAIQVRLFSPQLGVWKGVLMEKEGIDRIQLPRSMMKVGPSITYVGDWAVLGVTMGGIFPSSTNVQMAKIKNGYYAARNGIPKSFKEREPSRMIQNLWKESGVSSDLVKGYKEQCRDPNELKHASFVGVADPTGAIPEGYVFITGDDAYIDCVPDIYVTRFPCTSQNDGFLIPVLREKPDSMSDNQWMELTRHSFGGIIFANPPAGRAPMPTQIAGGDLDGDLYFCCWDSSIISALQHRRWSLRTVEHSVPENKEFREVGYDSEWLQKAQTAMADTQSMKKLSMLIGKLYKLTEVSFGEEKELFGNAYKEAIDIGKHGGKVHLPSCLWDRVQPAVLHSQLEDRTIDDN